MKAFIRIISLLSLAALLSVVMINCSKTEGNNTPDLSNTISGTVPFEKALIFDSGLENTDGIEDIIACIYECVNSMPVEALSDSEIETLNYVREEEFLARDVYIKMYEMYNVPVFNNISNSEFIHSTAMQALLEKYNLPDPGADHQIGVFNNQEIQALFDALVEQGSASPQDAIIVGATIEDVDIADLINHINNDVDNQDIAYALSQLWRGSRNHMRAFNAHLGFHGLTYTPQFITQEMYDQIVGTNWEVGNGFCVCQCEFSKDDSSKATE
jgi:hypothetical protein